MDPILTLAQWYLALDPAQLPDVPFRLSQCSVIRGERFFDQLRFECEAVVAFANQGRDKPHPRHKSGALAGQLEQLQQICKTLD